MDITFLHHTNLTPHICHYTFLPSRPVEYTPGQYADFYLPEAVVKTAEKPYRTFTLTSHPTDPHISFITRLDPPLSPYKQSLNALQPGDTLHMTDPMGDVVLPRLATTPLIFVAQGIALASYLSILHECERTVLAQSPVRGLSFHIVLLWVRRREDDPLETLIPSKVPGPTRLDFHYPARLTAADITPHVQPHSLIYLSGSQTFVEALGHDLEATGIPRARLIYDYYSGYENL